MRRFEFANIACSSFRNRSLASAAINNNLDESRESSHSPSANSPFILIAKNITDDSEIRRRSRNKDFYFKQFVLYQCK